MASGKLIIKNSNKQLLLNNNISSDLGATKIISELLQCKELLQYILCLKERSLMINPNPNSHSQPIWSNLREIAQQTVTFTQREKK